MKFLDDRKIENLNLENKYFEQIIASDTIFEHCNFLELKVSESSFRSCEFHHCVIGGSDFKNVKVSNCSFHHCVLVGIDWSECTTGGFLPFRSLKSCSMKYNYFIKMNLARFSFEKSQLEGCEFGDCNLSGADFRFTDLKDSKFYRNVMIKCDFRNAVNYSFDLRDNSVKGAKFSPQEAVNLLGAFEIEIE